MLEGLVETLESQALIRGSHQWPAKDARPKKPSDRVRQLARASGKSMRAVAHLVLEERPTTPHRQRLQRAVATVAADGFPSPSNVPAYENRRRALASKISSWT